MSERAFVDTNVFLYSFDSRAVQHEASKRLVQQTLSPEANLWASPQIFCELYRYLTHPSAQGPRDPAQVRDELEALFARPGIGMLAVPLDLTARIVQLLQSHPVRGRQVFDVQIAATMLANGVRRIYTYNGGDFPFDQIRAVEPPKQTATP